jgi:hypothetical protein
MEGMFLQQLTAEIPELRLMPWPPPSLPPFTLRPTITFIEPGFYAYVAAQPTNVKLTLQILGPDGRIFDEIKMEATEAAQMMNPSSGGRLRDCAKQLGNLTARYMRSRVFGEE